MVSGTASVVFLGYPPSLAHESCAISRFVISVFQKTKSFSILGRPSGGFSIPSLQAPIHIDLLLLLVPTWHCTRRMYSHGQVTDHIISAPLTRRRSKTPSLYEVPFYAFTDLNYHCSAFRIPRLNLVKRNFCSAPSPCYTAITFLHFFFKPSPSQTRTNTLGA
jgi:hypothetical protein